MFECSLENKFKEKIKLTGDEGNYQITNITGLNPPSAQINTSTVVGMDGTRFNSSKLEARNVVLTVKLNGEVESNRQRLYKFASSKDKCKFYFKNENRDVFLDCYIEKVECDLFTKSEILQASLIAPNPYFKDVEQIIYDISKVINAFAFPFSFGSNGATNPYVTRNTATDDAIVFSTLDLSGQTNVYNVSESETGINIQIDILSNCNTIQIRNTTTGELLSISYTFLQNDQVLIDTNRGSKSIRLIRNATDTNLFAALGSNSVFFQLQSGDNIFDYTVDNSTNNGAVQILFKYYNQYQGV